MSQHYESSPLSNHKKSDSGSSKGKFKFTQLFQLCVSDNKSPQKTKTRSNTMKPEEHDELMRTYKTRKVSGVDMVQQLQDHKFEYKLVSGHTDRTQQQEILALTQWSKCHSSNTTASDGELLRQYIQNQQLVKTGNQIMLMQMDFNDKLIKAFQPKEVILIMDSFHKTKLTPYQETQQVIMTTRLRNLHLIDCVVIVPFAEDEQIQVSDESVVQAYIERCFTLLLNSSPLILDKVILILPSRLNNFNCILSSVWHKILSRTHADLIHMLNEETQYQYSKQKPQLKDKNNCIYVFSTLGPNYEQLQEAFMYLKIAAILIFGEPQFCMITIKEFTQKLEIKFTQELNKLREYFCEQIFFTSKLNRTSKDQIQELMGIIQQSPLISLLKCTQKIQQDGISFIRLSDSSHRISYFTYLTGTGIIYNDQDFNILQGILQLYEFHPIQASFKIKNGQLFHNVSKSKSIQVQDYEEYLSFKHELESAHDSYAQGSLPKPSLHLSFNEEQ